MYAPKPYNEGHLEAADGHHVYFAEYGNHAGEAIVFCHGGPGSFSKPKHAQLFDLDRYRVILFDQRGCGQSTPRGERTANTTEHLLGDMERLRTSLGIEAWFVSGSSWGSTLATVYAIQHPTRTRGLLLSAFFLGDHASLRWGFSGESGIANMYPDVWEERQAFMDRMGATPESLAAICSEKLAGGSEAEKQEIVASILNWEMNLFTSQSDIAYVRPENVTPDEVVYAEMFLHYETNDLFLAPDYILNNAAVIAELPTIFVHGRHDLLCPLERLWALHTRLNQSRVVVLPQSHHALSADGVIAQRCAFESFLKDNV